MTQRNTPNYNPAVSGDLYAAFQQIIRTYLSTNVFTAMPATVQAVNNDGTVNLLPVIKQKTTLNESLDISDDDIIPNIKVLYFLGGGSEISFEAQAGDYGFLIACKQDISNYVSSHSTSDVASSRLFSFSNGMFFPLDFFGSPRVKLTIKRDRNGTTSSMIFDDDGIKIDTNKDMTVTVTGTANITANAVNVTAATNATVTALNTVEVSASSAIINAAVINLGAGTGTEGGVARKEDTVEVYITSGSSAGTWQGKITGGSSKVRAG